MENLQTSHLSNIPVDFDLPTGQRYVSYTFILVPPPFFLKGCNQIWNFLGRDQMREGKRKKGGKIILATPVKSGEYGNTIKYTTIKIKSSIRNQFHV